MTTNTSNYSRIMGAMFDRMVECKPYLTGALLASFIFMLVAEFKLPADSAKIIDGIGTKILVLWAFWPGPSRTATAWDEMSEEERQRSERWRVWMIRVMLATGCVVAVVMLVQILRR